MIFVVEAIGRRRCGRSAHRTRPLLASTRIAERALSLGTKRWLSSAGEPERSRSGRTGARTGTGPRPPGFREGARAAAGAGFAPCPCRRQKPTAAPATSTAATSTTRGQRRRRRRRRSTGWRTRSSTGVERSATGGRASGGAVAEDDDVVAPVERPPVLPQGGCRHLARIEHDERIPAA